MRPNREMIKAKYGGRCAYCGIELGERWHKDHIESKQGGGSDEVDNYNPACPRCNNWKGGMTVEEFRGEIAAQTYRIERDNANWRLAHDFGLVAATGKPVVFYFEEGGE